jgi:hypothetical protein
MSGCTSNRITTFVIHALGLSTNYAKQNRDRFARDDTAAVTARLLLRYRAKSHAESLRAPDQGVKDPSKPNSSV